MFGITLKSYLSYILGHKFHEDVAIQHDLYYYENVYCLFTLEKAKSPRNTLYLLKSVKNITVNHYFIKLDGFAPFCWPVYG